MTTENPSTQDIQEKLDKANRFGDILHKGVMTGGVVGMVGALGLAPAAIMADVAGVAVANMPFAGAMAGLNVAAGAAAVIGVVSLGVCMVLKEINMVQERKFTKLLAARRDAGHEQEPSSLAVDPARPSSLRPS